jgi:hypothetical protein
MAAQTSAMAIIRGDNGNEPKHSDLYGLTFKLAKENHRQHKSHQNHHGIAEPILIR